MMPGPAWSQDHEASTGIAKEARDMRRRLAEWIESKPRAWEWIKLAVFVLTIVAPTLFLSLYARRFVLGLFLLFPLGLFAFLPRSTTVAHVVLGWLAYIAIAITGAKSKKLIVSVAWYILLVGLLIVNVKGCVSIIDDASSSTW